MFLDASAVVGILNDEDEKAELLARIDTAHTPLTMSAIATVESVTVLATRLGVSIETAHDIVRSFVELLKVRTVPVTAEIGSGAIRAYSQYGKGRGHPAKLNMGDCFAYATAKNYGIPLLYKGGDFVHTDLA
jgi:ribonuclease VapC